MQKGTIRKVIDYFFQYHSGEMTFAMREFFDDQDIRPGGKLNIQDDREEDLFMEWLTFDYRLKNGKKLIEDFISINPHKMTKADLQIYEDLQMNKYGFYEILSVKKDQYIELESLQSGKIYKAQEKAGTHNVKPKSTLICRVGKVGDHFELIGCDPLGWPAYSTDRLKKIFRRDKSSLTPKDARKMLLDKDDEPSEFEKNLEMKDEDLIEKRVNIINQLEKQLAKVKSPACVDDILKIIFKEKYNIKGNDYLPKIINMLDNGKKVVNQELIDLAASAWNYFPHKSLGGKSPSEKAKELYGDKSKNKKG